MKQLLVFIFLFFIINKGESKPTKGFIWPNATLWSNVTLEKTKRSDTALLPGK
jgi:hypothetical protein